MTFTPVTSDLNSFLYLVRDLYEETFPLAERRRWEDLLKILHHPKMRLEIVTSREEFVGFVVWWRLNNYLYIEHLAIVAAQRGKQYGNNIVRHFIDRSPLYLVLETELPLLEDAAKRIAFYEKLGMKKALYSYLQPPYRKNGSPVPMHLMTLKPLNNHEEFSELAMLIKKEVYEPFW